MKTDYYEAVPSEDCLIFRFESISEFRSIPKIIAYTKLSRGSKHYNLSLCDILEGGKICDLSISNNSDMHKVIATVVKSMITFFGVYPDFSIYIRGSTPGRTRLYNIIISKELSEAKRIFEIYGFRGKTKEVFIPNRVYDAFLITYLNDTTR